jgi:uncharacterized OsmC-like protein
MADDWIVNTVRTTTTHVHGRTMCSAGVHHFVLDGPSRPNEEVVSMEAFLASLGSCATHLIEDFAEEEGIPLQRVGGVVEAVRRANELNCFDHIDLRLELVGPLQDQAEHLVERFKGRCPIYRTIAASAEVRVGVRVVSV